MANSLSISDRNLLNSADRRVYFDEITVSLASPEKVRAWSYGEVRLPETINYRTFKPEPGGLFCAKIFGPIKDYECLCGKYKRVKYRNMVCEKCGVEVTVERVRRERMGHINLACPVAHILFFKSVPSRIGVMMDLTMRDIERILYFEAYVVLDPKRVPDLERGMMIKADDYKKYEAEYGRDSFDAGIGAEGLRDFLQSMDLADEREILNNELKEAKSASKRAKIYKRLKLIDSFYGANLRPEWMILEALPVLPPGLRPLVQLDGGRFTTSDLNDLYRRVINRNNRLRKFLDLNAPDIIVNNEKRMLQEAVDSLLDNGRRGKPAVGPNKRPLKSLADIVKGKSGRFRQNLLGKRVDFSARSVIVVGPSLQLHQCGLPKHMALNLFRPFVFNALVAQGLVSNIKQARYKVDNPDGEVWDILARVIHQHPVMLNRAPTLHRLGIQAFEPVLIEGKAIQLHPLVCVAFNADFDGDQMAVHVPLSLEAQAEVRTLMLSVNNILAPASGEPIILPTQDIVLGIYYATRERVNARGEGMRFYDLPELETALSVGAVDLQAKIKFPVKSSRVTPEAVAAAAKAADADAATDNDETKREDRELVETTAGRALMTAFYPENMPFAHINSTLKKKDLTRLVNKICRSCGLRETVLFCDRLMRFGFEQATRAGISICINDMVIPSRKNEIVERAESEMEEAKSQFDGGLLTEDERYNKSVDLWDKAGDEISKEMMRELSYEPVTDPKTGKVLVEDNDVKMQSSFNSLYMMADSGARGSQTQMKQLAGMRGLMTKPDGRIMEQAITANFREGLTALEYFLSTHGARKGLSDTALKTANSGYLTRRLVDVAQDTVINAQDCGTDEGITVRAVLMGGEVVASLAERVLGRVLARDIAHPQTGETLYEAGVLINESEADTLASAGVDEVMVRSPVKCRLPHGLCVKCYGRDLARGRRVQMGEAVGVIAAQSIGEPGTQLTMRTFHIGGAASADMSSNSVEAKSDGELRIHARTVKNARNELVVVSRGGEMSVHDKDGRERERYRLRYGEVLKVKNNGQVKAGQQISYSDPLSLPIITEYDGIVQIVGLEEGVNARRQTDEITGVENMVVTEDKRAGKKIVPVQIKLKGADGKPVCTPGTETEVKITLRPGMTILTGEGKQARVGDIVATMPQEAIKSRDITGGLPRVAELFEAREPKESSLLSPANGQVRLGGVVRQKQMVEIEDEAGEVHEIAVPKGQNVLVQDGMVVKKGDEIVEGEANPHEILAMRGIEALAKHIVDEVQAVYRLQGVTIDDKHIEVIVHQMLRCVVVDDPGDSFAVKAGDQITLSHLMAENNRLSGGINDDDVDKKPIRYHPILLGITKASLATDSFISAASFQETSRVLTEAAVSGRRDPLRGLKENVIVGRLIPAGTGFIHYERAKRESSMEAEKIMREELIEAAIAPPDAMDAATAAAAAAASSASTAAAASGGAEGDGGAPGDAA